MHELKALEDKLDIQLVHRPTHPLAQTLHGYWESIMESPTSIPNIDQFDPIKVPQALPFVSLVDILGSGQDFKIRLMGTGAVALVNEDRTGKRTNEIAENHDKEHSEYLRNYWEILFRTAYSVRKPFHFQTTMAESERSHIRLEISILPMKDSSDALKRFLLGTFKIEPSLAVS